MPSRSVVFAEPVRTPVGIGGNLKEVPAPALGAVAIGAALKPAGLNTQALMIIVI
jgi:acetyl-CoA C-acetyltransferase